MQAAITSAITYACGAALPLLAAWLSPLSTMIVLVSAVSLVVLTLLGGVAARAGGAGIVVGATRVLVWGAFALLVTAGIGKLFGAVV